MCARRPIFPFFFFNDTATTEIYTLSLHDALPISWSACRSVRFRPDTNPAVPRPGILRDPSERSEEHTSELQSQSNLVCRLLLEKKKKTQPSQTYHHSHTPRLPPPATLPASLLSCT